MLKGFRDFITRGDVIDLAVAVVIGTAFGILVDQLTQSFPQPLIRVILGGHANSGAFFVRGQEFDYGAFINAAITFLLTAAAIYYLVVVPMNRMIAHRAARLGADAGTAELTDEVRLLTEIRDELRSARR